MLFFGGNVCGVSRRGRRNDMIQEKDVRNMLDSIASVKVET